MIKVIYEDNEIMVVEKPEGLIVNRSDTTEEETLEDILKNEFSINIERSGIVHRLDKDTSGVLLVAKTEDSMENLQKQFKDREIEKIYTAIVHGSIENEVVEINAPLKRNPRDPFKFAVVSGGRYSFTKVLKIKEVCLDTDKYTLVDVFPKTGRTHQIRVHLSAINHPIVGDLIYCPQKLLESSLKSFDRMMLHARFLSINHPRTGKKMDFSLTPPKSFDL